MNKLKNRNAIFCPVCNKKFARKDNFQTHYKKDHTDVNDIVTASTSTQQPDYLDPVFNYYVHAFISDQLDPKLLVDMKNIARIDSTILRAKASKLEFKFSELALKLSAYGMFPDVIEQVFDYLTSLHKANDEDLMCVSLESDNYLTFPINTAVSKWKNFQISQLLGMSDVDCRDFSVTYLFFQIVSRLSFKVIMICRLNQI